MALYKHAMHGNRLFMKLIRFPLTRLLIGLVFLIAAVYLVEILMGMIGGWLGDERSGTVGWYAAKNLAYSAASILSYWLLRALIEGQSLLDLNPKKMLAQISVGILAGAGFISLIMAILAVSGAFTISGMRNLSVIWPMFFMSVQAGVMEEILSRGLIFRLVEELTGTWLSLLVSAFIFGFLHSWNDNATVFSSVSISLTAGVVLAQLYVITRQLWVPIGMHFAWNFTLGAIYGAPVSGGKAYGLFRSRLDGNEWLTGGDFGPEASVVTVLVFGVLAIFLGFWMVRKQLIVPPLWRKPGQVQDLNTKNNDD